MVFSGTVNTIPNAAFTVCSGQCECKMVFPLILRGYSIVYCILILNFIQNISYVGTLFPSTSK